MAMSITGSIKRALYRRLSLENYLKVLSAGFFAGLRLGLGRRSPAYEYPRFLKNLVREGDIVIDIGANLGYYSRILSGLVGPGGKVYAVEPVKPILGVLEHNLRHCRNVEIVPYALGGEDKQVTMVNDSSRYTGYMGTGRNYISDDEEMENHGKMETPDEVEGGLQSPQSRSVSVVDLLSSSRYLGKADNSALLSPRRSDQGDATAEDEGLMFEADMRRGSELFASLDKLDFIKCDIEGYESVVIPEMAPVIQKHLPVILLETGGANRRGMIELLREWGYAGYVLQNGRLVSVMRAPEKDIVFIPGHRHAGFTELIAK
jgi:FkbM family methyltransferase